ncbi:MAG TPA: sugar ABC transporter permease [Candidatus Hydrogenedentes bacterium]|nr:sugar ABC transporter permease [Candidatus Hydrogenedentota bacterium]HQE84183.1 sugar ABC transporter permease [Candidatus Hydrogenedentota bacterium]HQH54398.1 sugar ABC transporter permease [Candidatus Hydrogenedentota bacterium]HQM47890.1 sugar ABC transporter permease [Candidatus Hydrogenedentota bacterium]
MNSNNPDNAAATRGHGARNVKRRRAGQPPLALVYGLLLAPVAFLLTFNYIPAVSALYHAFTKWDIGGESTWIWLANFTELARDPVFHKSIVNIAKLGAFVFVANLTVPFVVAEMIFHLKSERWSYLCRVAVVLPMIVPGVVTFMLWGYIYSDAGILTELLVSLGRYDWVHGWLSDPKTALWAVAFVGFPFAGGFNILIYYAGLANIPGSVLEAAELDGLGALGRIARIHIPLVLQQVKLLVVVTVIGVVNGFESIYILTLDGGPGYETTVPGLYMYLNGFSYQRMGYACAIGLLMLLFLLAFTLTLNRFMRTESYEPET